MKKTLKRLTEKSTRKKAMHDLKELEWGLDKEKFENESQTSKPHTTKR